MGQELTTKARERQAHLRFVGRLTSAQAEERRCRLVETEHGEGEHGPIHLSWLVDQDGFIRLARFESAAPEPLPLVYDLMVEMSIGCTVDMAAAITPEQILFELQWRFEQQELALPFELRDPFPVLLKAAKRYHGLVLETAEADAQEAARKRADWDRQPLMERLRRIEAVFEGQIRPMLAADGGGIEVVDLQDEELWITYSGACDGCASALGGTLFFVVDTLRSALGVELRVRVKGLE